MMSTVTDKLAPDEPVAAAVPHPSDARAQSRNLQIQWLRLSAALSVLLYHASVIAESELHDGRFAQVFVPGLAMFGVALFFAISGYLMATAIRVQKPFLFLAHRAIRIYPLLWAIYAVLFMAERFGGAPLNLDFASLLLVPHEQLSGPLSVEWSLVFEMTFYVSIFAIGLFKLAHRLPRIALAWLAVLAVETLLYPNGESPHLVLTRVLCHPACVPLAFGLLIPSVVKRRLPPALLLGTGVALCALHSFDPYNHDLGRWLFGAGTALILAAAITLTASRPSFGDNRLGRGLARAADQSYALYLVHMPIIALLYGFQGRLAPGTLWMAAVAASIIVAGFTGWAEMTLYRRSKALVTAADPRLVKAAMAGFAIAFIGLALPDAYFDGLLSLRASRATSVAALLERAAATSPTHDPVAYAVAAGFHPSADLTGSVDGVKWTGGRMNADGWALDLGKRPHAPSIVLFQDGHVIAATGTAYARPDVRSLYHLGGHAGFEIQKLLPCRPDPALKVLALTEDKRYAVLPIGSAAHSCN